MGDNVNNIASNSSNYDITHYSATTHDKWEPGGLLINLTILIDLPSSVLCYFTLKLCSIRKSFVRLYPAPHSPPYHAYVIIFLRAERKAHHSQQTQINHRKKP